MTPNGYIYLKKKSIDTILGTISYEELVCLMQINIIQNNKILIQKYTMKQNALGLTASLID